jgi:hypothetical protein
VKDAADTFGLFARRNPLHAQAPQLQARVIDIYEQPASPRWRSTRRRNTSRATASTASSARPTRRAGRRRSRWSRPTAELARHYHASAQKSKASADYQEAVRWYRAYLASFPTDPQARAEQLPARRAAVRGRASPRPASSTRRPPTAIRRTPRAPTRLRRAARYARAGEGAPRRAAGAAAGTASTARCAFAQAFPSDTRAGPVLTERRREALSRCRTRAAATVAQQVLRLQPPRAGAAPRRLDRARAHRVRARRLR